MIRVGGALVVLQVARIASSAKAFVNSARMALDAGSRRVLSRQRESSLRRVVKGGSAPIGGGVAELAILRESSRRVIRIVGALVVSQVARIASRAEAFVNSARMTLDASRRRMLAGEWERGLRGVIEFRAAPIDGGVALRAILREPGRRMVRIGSALVVLQVT